MTSPSIRYLYSMIGVVVFSLLFVTELQKENPNKIVAILFVVALIANSLNANPEFHLKLAADTFARPSGMSRARQVSIMPMGVAAFSMLLFYVSTGFWLFAAAFVSLTGAVAAALLALKYLKGAST